MVNANICLCAALAALWRARKFAQCCAQPTADASGKIALKVTLLSCRQDFRWSGTGVTSPNLST